MQHINFKLKEGVELRWGTYAMRLFCNKQGITIDGFFELISELSEGASVDKMFQVMENMISAGFEAATGKTVAASTVCDWIDECGGIMKIGEGPIRDYVNYIVSTTINGVTPLGGDGVEEKKSETQAPGTTY